MKTWPPVTDAAKGVTDDAAREERVTTILMVARVSNGVRDDLCRVRNISPGGMRIEILAPVDVGQQLWVELKNGITVQSEVVWVRPAEAGVRFDDTVEIAELLAPRERSKNAGVDRTIRSPRLSARSPVALRHEGRILSGVLTDISQGGARLHCNGKVKMLDEVVVFVPGLRSHRATVRWVLVDAIGISFDEKLGFAELAQWLASDDRFAGEADLTINPTRQSS